jgi:hypothetical protein
MALPGILQANGHHERDLFVATSANERSQLRPGRIEAVVGGIATKRGSSHGSGLPHLLLPPGKARMHRRHRTQAFGSASRVVEPGVPRRRVAPEHAWQVADPGLVDADPLHRREQRIR